MPRKDKTKCDLRKEKYKMRCWLVKKRMSKKFTQEKMAEKLGISRTYYTLIERGQRMPHMSMDLVIRLSVILGVPADKIIRLEEKWMLENMGG